MRSEYAAYLRDRGWARLLLRRLFFLPVRRFFNGRVLDIGSGIGEFLEIYRDAVGVDRDMDNVSYCAGRGRQCLCADAYSLPFREGSFDGVLLSNVLEHLEHPDAAMKEVTRVLRDGGRIMVELPGRKGYAFDSTHVRFWGETDIVSYLTLHGFRDIRASYFPVPCERAGDVLTHNKLRVYAVYAQRETSDG